jgi:hypothetical protein
MASAVSRGQIVTDALSLAGRGQELRGPAAGWLNYFLRRIGLTFRFPELRKNGAQQVLSLGLATAPLPSDFGAGMEKLGMAFGINNQPISEYSFEEFAYNNGFPQPPGTGFSQFYVVDRQAGVFRFNKSADQAYTFTPTYFETPPQVPVDSGSDGLSVWIDNDVIAVEGLVHMIFKFTKDERENAQMQRVEALLNEWKRETTKLGGTSRVMPSPQRFKRMALNGFGYGP